MFDGGINLDWHCDPLDLLARWPIDRPVFMLHSARPDANWSRHTVIAEPGQAVRHQNGRTRFSDQHSDAAKQISPTHHPFSDLRQLLEADEGRSLWLGTLGYDLARSIEHLPHPAAADRGWPDFQLERCPGWLVHDNQTHQWTAHGSYTDIPPIHADAEHSGVSGTTTFFAAGPITPDQPTDQVKRSIQRAIDYISAGDVFQVNLAQRFSSPFCGNARAFYLQLCKQSPAWYGAYGELTRFDENEPKRTLASISPELFLEVDPDRRVTTRPIKGTRPSSDPADTLRDSDKDRAELAMIVDLMRNDLGRVCSYGSIKVDDARSIESHPTVHHGVATITGKLHPNRDLVDLLRATLPGGSITGAPKVRAMQIIDELEPARRGPYCGAIGMIHGQQTRLNIAIRTVLIEQDEMNGQGRADVWAGGGIVADSDPDSEYQEMLDKAKAIREALELKIPTCRG
ncbi:MAG: anthranilate synthase component I family protein [Phycisphaeraceae bacterium]|nr:anthranilate synthase component I family protein [Phycisphaeraceae bacterium]